MTALISPANPGWPSITRLETVERLLGGEDGPLNRAPRELLERTEFLKKKIDDAVSGALTIEYANRLKTARNIEMTGDGTWAVTFDGSGNVSGVLTLAGTGIAPGSYAVTTFDAKGRATGGRALLAADIPALDWSKLTTGKPTTLGGYGITDALLASSYTAADVLTKIKTVDGAGSGLDADQLDGQDGSYYLAWGNFTNKPTTLGGYGITDALLASSYTAADVLTKIKTVDGAGSGLDADLLDGQEGSYYLAWGNLTGKPTTLAGYGITDAVTKDAQGNIGVGVVPETWDAQYPVIRMNTKTAYAADANSSYMGTNWYHTAGVYKRLASGYALMYQQDSAAGKHLLKTGPSDVAGTTITWTTAMSLDIPTGIMDVPAGMTVGTPGATDNSTRSATTAWCHPRTAQAWVTFNGSTGAIRSSFNVSSVTRNAAGDYTIAFTNALADSNFSFAPGVGRGATNIDCLANLHHSYTRNTANVRIGTTIASQAATTYYQDMPEVSLIIFGN